MSNSTPKFLCLKCLRLFPSLNNQSCLSEQIPYSPPQRIVCPSLSLVIMSIPDDQYVVQATINSIFYAIFQDLLVQQSSAKRLEERIQSASSEKDRLESEVMKLHSELKSGKKAKQGLENENIKLHGRSKTLCLCWSCAVSKLYAVHVNA